jgi:hypothetical protein
MHNSLSDNNSAIHLQFYNFHASLNQRATASSCLSKNLGQNFIKNRLSFIWWLYGNDFAKKTLKN